MRIYIYLYIYRCINMYRPTQGINALGPHFIIEYVYVLYTHTHTHARMYVHIYTYIHAQT